MALYREDLERGQCVCDDETCSRGGEMYFHPRCHPKSPTWISYFGDVLTLSCAACRRPIGSIVVASKHLDVPAT